MHQSLNPNQKKAVEKINGPLLVLAGAGTGKTKVLTHRIAHIIASGVRPEKIVALTFTNKAAKEMKERLYKISGKISEEVFLGTFHSFCLKILRKEFKLLNLTPWFSIILPSEQLDLCQKAISLLENKKMDLNAKNILPQISLLKNYLLSSEDCYLEKIRKTLGEKVPLIFEDEIYLAQMKTVYQNYEAIKKMSHVIDFDDCLFLVYRLFLQDREIVKKYHDQFHYYLVDEFQDTNFSQLKILSLLVNIKENICAVGDDDQSIYSWRGADPHTIINFEKMWPNTEIITLDQNYRSSNAILNAANLVIRNNSKRKEKNLWSDKEKNVNEIELDVWEGEGDESRGIAEKCNEIFLRENKKENLIAVLYRTNQQGRNLETGFMDLKIPYQIFGGMSFFERKEVRDFLSIIRVLFKPKEEISFVRSVLIPPWGIGLKTIETIQSQAQNKKCSSTELILEYNFQENPNSFNKKILSGLEKYKEAYLKLKAMPLKNKEEIKKFSDEIIHLFHMREAVIENSKDEKTKFLKLDHLRALSDWFANSLADKVQDRNIQNWLDQGVFDEYSCSQGA